jgi:hypothetical protein
VEGGEPDPVYCRESLSDYHQKALAALREGILSCNPDSHVDPDRAYALLRRLGLHPTREEARFLALLQAARGFGSVRDYHSLSEHKSLIYNILNWNHFYREFKNALWRPGYWAQLSLVERLLLKQLSPKGTRSFRIFAGS